MLGAGRGSRDAFEKLFERHSEAVDTAMGPLKRLGHVLVRELRQAELVVGPSPLSWQFRLALIVGSRSAMDSAVSAALFLVRVLPSLLLRAMVLVPPAILVRRRYRPRARV
jgi:hypothetical protein